MMLLTIGFYQSAAINIHLPDAHTKEKAVCLQGGVGHDVIIAYALLR